MPHCARLLITLSLMNDGALSRFTFYPSYQLKLRRTEYYQILTSVREFGDCEGWVSFFCECIAEAADDAAKSLGKLVDLHTRSEQSIRRSLSRGAPNGLAFLELLEPHPIITISMVAEKLGVGRTTASNLVNDFMSMGLLCESDPSRQRYRLFSYEPYLRVLRTGSDPL